MPSRTDPFGPTVSDETLRVWSAQFDPDEQDIVKHLKNLVAGFKVAKKVLTALQARSLPNISILSLASTITPVPAGTVATILPAGAKLAVLLAKI